MLKISGRSIWLRIPRQDARGFRASLSGWVGSCEGDEIPGVEEGMGRVGVTWRVVGESGVLGGLASGEDLFG
jgi:ribonuclease P/MRP protein subunit POP8